MPAFGLGSLDREGIPGVIFGRLEGGFYIERNGLGSSWVRKGFVEWVDGGAQVVFVYMVGQLEHWWQNGGVGEGFSFCRIAWGNILFLWLLSALILGLSPGPSASLLAVTGGGDTVSVWHCFVF
jgi:hypothetical protein